MKTTSCKQPSWLYSAAADRRNPEASSVPACAPSIKLRGFGSSQNTLEPKYCAVGRRTVPYAGCERNPACAEHKAGQLWAHLQEQAALGLALLGSGRDAHPNAHRQPQHAWRRCVQRRQPVSGLHLTLLIPLNPKPNLTLGSRSTPGADASSAGSLRAAQRRLRVRVRANPMSGLRSQQEEHHGEGKYQHVLGTGAGAAVAPAAAACPLMSQSKFAMASTGSTQPGCNTMKCSAAEQKHATCSRVQTISVYPINPNTLHL